MLYFDLKQSGAYCIEIKHSQFILYDSTGRSPSLLSKEEANLSQTHTLPWAILLCSMTMVAAGETVNPVQKHLSPKLLMQNPWKIAPPFLTSAKSFSRHNYILSIEQRPIPSRSVSVYHQRRIDAARQAADGVETQPVLQSIVELRKHVLVVVVP